eukprot:TRINITY_DN1984_c0_g1_i1.p1 TRINITY_DN1984_c0_g1~~TRINITY_DN1984_c0_g1_i1.p1  ORF type:complete len:111 (+),score=0.22 TRINITY_DN1984_c0_g1_i1:96-428(+)
MHPPRTTSIHAVGHLLHLEQPYDRIRKIKGMPYGRNSYPTAYSLAWQADTPYRFFSMSPDLNPTTTSPLTAPLPSKTMKVGRYSTLSVPGRSLTLSRSTLQAVTLSASAH